MRTTYGCFQGTPRIKRDLVAASFMGWPDSLPNNGIQSRAVLSDVCISTVQVLLRLTATDEAAGVRQDAGRARIRYKTGLAAFGSCSNCDGLAKLGCVKHQGLSAAIWKRNSVFVCSSRSADAIRRPVDVTIYLVMVHFIS
jgi:hypothetical protein